MQPQQWTCPYCNRPCTIDENDHKFLRSAWNFISVEHFEFEGIFSVIICPNPLCRRETISAYILERSGFKSEEHLRYKWELLPESEARPFPDYIPQAILADYKEACLIKSKSPKASATLSRRCLQGMIRDYWGVSKNRLKDEIDALKDKLDTQTWQAIDSVRQIGNIGAHMEQDVNLVIDIEPNEAGLLIGLIETLLEEWYIARYEREQRMKKVIETAQAKQ